MISHTAQRCGLAELVGHELPSPEAARRFLNAFHEEEKIEEAQQRVCPMRWPTFRREPSARGLGRVNRDLVQRLGNAVRSKRSSRRSRRHDHREPQTRGLYTYEGSRGYQPMLAVWAEMDVVLADEFRDGMCRRRWLR